MRHGRATHLAAVIFDVDGTLVNTKRLYIEAYRQAVLPFVGRELSRKEILALRPRCEIRFLRDVVGEDRLDVCMAAFHQAYAALHAEHFRGVYPGIPELLASLRAARVPLGIVTGKSRRSWEISAPHAPLGHFDTLVFADDVAEPKPDPEGIRLALGQLRADPGKTYYLGDTVSDMEAARAAGVRPAAALWAWKPERREYIIAHARELGAEIFTTPAEFLRMALAGGERVTHN